MQQPPYDQPPQYPYPQIAPPPPKPPGRIKRFTSWYRVQNRVMQIIVALGIIAVVLFVGSAAVSGIIEGATGATLTPTAQVDQPTPTSAPTQAQTPTATPKRTGPTRAQIDELVATDPDVEVKSYNQKTATLVVRLTYGYRVPISQMVVKTNLRDIQALFWQKGWYFSSLTSEVYTTQQTGPDIKEASGTLTYATASTIDWTFAGDIWDKYDKKFIDPKLPAN